MIDYKLFEFAAAPFTGVGFLIKTIQLAGLGPGFRHQVYSPFPERNGSHILRVTLIRHPCDWLMSCYSAVRKNQIQTNHIGHFQLLDCSSFRAFVHSYLQDMPGGLWKLYCNYQADISLRVEDLPHSFVGLARSLGISETFLELCSKSRIYTETRRWDSSLRKSVMEAERELCDEYEYF